MWGSLIQSIEGLWEWNWGLPAEEEIVPQERSNSSCLSCQPAGRPDRLQTCWCPQVGKLIPCSVSLKSPGWSRSRGGGREKVSYCSILHPYTHLAIHIRMKKRGYSTLIARTRERRKERQETGHRKIWKMCACLWKWGGARIGEHGQLKTGHRRPAVPPYPCHHLLSAHYILDAALSSWLSLTPTTNLPGWGAGGTHHFTDVATGRERW